MQKHYAKIEWTELSASGSGRDIIEVMARAICMEIEGRCEVRLPSGGTRILWMGYLTHARAAYVAAVMVGAIR